MYTFGSLFSGIGGLDLGLERAGWHCRWQVEKDEFRKKILAKHWPEVTRYGDIRAVNTATLERVDLIAGGFPCQSHSLAGKRNGSADERDLWPEFYRIICELRPTWILAENVLGLLSSDSGRFFGRILRDLAQMRYDAWWQMLSAADFGAPHLRRRVFVVAHRSSATDDGPDAPVAHSQCLRSRQYDSNSMQQRWQKATQQAWMGSCHVGDTNPARLQVRDWCPDETWAPVSIDRYGTGQFESGMGRIPDGIPDRMDCCHRWPAGPGEEPFEWEPYRITQEKIPQRSARLKALGDSVVPQCAEYMGRIILSMEMP